MAKKNCWEFMNCERQPGGKRESQLGPCPTVGFFTAHGLNDGINGGRACWAIAGTFCHGEVQGSFVAKIKQCADCDFFHHVQEEEGNKLATTPEIMKKIDMDGRSGHQPFHVTQHHAPVDVLKDGL